MADFSLSDIRSMLPDRDDNDLVWIIMLFLLWGRNGFGGNDNGALTRADLNDGLNFQQLESAVRGVQSGLCDGFYAMNNGMLQGMNSIQRDLCTGFNAVNTGISENRFAAQSCCCETNRNIDAVRAENYKNTCEIVNAIRTDGEATRALINANTMQELRDKLCDVKNENTQYRQSTYILGQLGRFVTNPPCNPTCNQSWQQGTTF